VSFLGPGLTTVPITIFGFTSPPELGITGTPVIDPDSGTMYVVAKLRNTNQLPNVYYERLYALDIATGAAKFGSPLDIKASVIGFGGGSVGGMITLDPLYEFQRAALLLLNGIVYISFSSQGDQGNYHGWVLGYDAQTLQLIQVHNDTPNGSKGGIWMSGAGPAADAQGNVYCMTGNGTFDTSGTVTDYGNSFIKLTPSDTTTNLQVSDYFTPTDVNQMNAIDGDLGSGSPLILPDNVGSAAHPHLMLGCGKDFIIYLVDRDNMGQYHPNDNNQIVGTNTLSHGLYGAPAYFNGRFYYLGVNDLLKAFSITNAQISSGPVSQSPDSVGFPGAIPSISANGTANGIAWIIQADSTSPPAKLIAYNATNLNQRLYRSSDTGSRDSTGMPQKFSVPTIANGKVYVCTAFGLAVFGNLGPPFITTQPQAQSVVPGATVNFNAAAGGSPPLSFQWTKDGVNISGATNSWLTLSNVQANAAGMYSARVSNAISNAISDSVQLNVTVPPVLAINSQLQITLQGQVGVTYTIQFNDDPGLSPDAWMTLTVVTLANPTQSIIDPTTEGQTQRFYRAVVVQ
jgi:hypothetical protein